MECVLEQTRIRPSVAKVILRAGPKGRGEFLAIDEKLFITFTPPTAARVPDMQHHADKAAQTFGLEHRPINLPVRVSGKQRVAVPFGVESPELLNRTRKRGMRKFKTNRVRLGAVIDELDLGSLLK